MDNTTIFSQIIRLILRKKFQHLVDSLRIENVADDLISGVISCQSSCVIFVAEIHLEQFARG